MKYLFLWLIGAAAVRIPGGSVSRVTEALFAAGLPVMIRRRRRDGGRTVILRARDVCVFESICQECGVDYEIKKMYGLPVLLRRYRRRVGLFIGGALLVAALFISDDFVWRIDVTGNESIPDERIIEELRELGFGLGTYHKNVDFDVLHNKFLMASPDIVWIAINMKGSVARVEVREYMPGGEPPPAACANIVARCGGKITNVMPYSGSAQVKIGEEVEAGQLLISGVVEYEGAGVEFVYARGEVYAEVEREIFVSIPLSFEEKVKTDDILTEYGIKIFDREIFFGGRGRIDPAFYDTITAEDDVVLLNTVRLPIKIVKTQHTRIDTVSRTLTETEASALAYREYKLAFADACRGATLLSYTVDGGMNEAGDAYEIRCTITEIEDIAKTQEFEITDGSPAEGKIKENG